MVNPTQAKLRSPTKNGVSSSTAASNIDQPTSSSSLSTMSAAQIMEIVRKSLRSGSDWPDKDELLDVIYWGRQILGAILGIVWGLIPFSGLIGIGVYLLITTALVHIYVTSYQRQDDERFGGFWELAKEGFGSSLATFMVCWIIVYTAVYFDTVST